MRGRWLPAVLAVLLLELEAPAAQLVLTDVVYFSGVFTRYNASDGSTLELNGIGEILPSAGAVSKLGMGLDLPSEGFDLLGDQSGYGLFVAGSYSLANAEEVARISHVINGSMLPVDMGASNSVYAMALHQPSGLLYMGGLFTEVTGVQVGYVTSYDGSDWDTMGGGVGIDFNCLASRSGETPRLSAVVHAIALMGGDANAGYLGSPTKPKVFVGGHFAMAGDVKANNIAMWNPVAGKWEALCDPNPPNRCNIQGVSDDPRREDVQHPIVLALALHEASNRLFVGGIFATAGQSHNYIDALSTYNIVTKAWEMVGGGIAGRNPVVYDILIKEDKVYVAGSFQFVAKTNVDTLKEGTRSHSCAVFDAASNTWAALGGSSLGEGAVYSIAMGVTGTLYAGGDIGEITLADGTSKVQTAGLVKYMVATSWQALLPAGSALDGIVHSVHARPVEKRLLEVVSSRLLLSNAVSLTASLLLVASAASIASILAQW